MWLNCGKYLYNEWQYSDSKPASGAYGASIQNTMTSSMFTLTDLAVPELARSNDRLPSSLDGERDALALSMQLSGMQKENEQLLEQSQKLLLQLTGQSQSLDAGQSDSLAATRLSTSSDDTSRLRSSALSHSLPQSHHQLAHGVAEQAAQQLLLQQRVRRSEEEVTLIRQQLNKKQTAVARQQNELQQQLIKSQGTLDDMSRTLHAQNQEIANLRGRLEDTDTKLMRKTAMVTSLESELAASMTTWVEERERCAAEVNDMRHNYLVEQGTVSKKIDEVVKHVREKEEELVTLAASMTTHELTMHAKDALIAGLEEKLRTSRQDMERQSIEIVEQRQNLSSLQRDAEKGERQVFQLTTSLQQCQKQLELHVQDTKTAELMRAQHQRVVNELKARISELEHVTEKKSLECRQSKAKRLELEATIAQVRHGCSFAEQRQRDAENNGGLLKSELSRTTAELQLCQAALHKERQQLEDLTFQVKHLEQSKSQLTDDTAKQLKMVEDRQEKTVKEKAELEAAYEKQKEHFAQAKLERERQWQSEVQLTEKLTTSNADLLKCRKGLQDRQEQVTHVELHLEELKSQLHGRDRQCSELKSIVERQKQNMMQRASQVNELVLSVQAAQSKQQDEADALHAEVQQLQSDLQNSRLQSQQLAAEMERANTLTTETQNERDQGKEERQSLMESVSTLRADVDQWRQEASKAKTECSALKANMSRLSADCDEKQTDLLESERKRQAAERKSTEMENQLRLIHRRLTESDTTNTVLTAELTRAKKVVQATDEVGLSKVQLLEQQLSTIRDAYQQQVEDLRSKHTEMLLAQEEREVAHRQGVASQAEILESCRRQETMAQLTAAQCSAELVRVKNQLQWFQNEVVLKDASMREVDSKLSSLEHSIGKSPP